MQTWRLDDEIQTVVLAAPEGGLPGIAYWGAPLPASEDLATLAAAQVVDVSGGMMDATAPISVCPEARRAFPGQPGLRLSDAQGRAVTPCLALGTVEAGPDRFEATASEGGITYQLSLHLREGLLVSKAALEMDAPHRVEWLAAPVLPVPAQSDGLTDVSGRWIGEFQLQRHDWRPGIHLREARQGRSGHEHPPFALLTTPGTTNAAGEVWALAYGWPGGHRMVAEELPDGRRQIQFGHATGAYDGLVTRVESAELTGAYSAAGLNGAAVRLQRHLRALTAPRARQPRPVHYNCWEAVYFDHDRAVLDEIAEQAAELGAERFVLDDGWFGRRDDDTTSLGDWEIDPRKWPDGLAPFAEYVRDLGMGFGLWVEPEMVNFDSALYRAHPDWLLGPADQPPGRQQYVLDLAQEAVRDHLFKRLDAVLSSAPIEYLKWDHNRLLPMVDAAQVAGLYDLLDRLHAAHPTVEIESCASGGGRIDLGILSRTQRVWLSDSNDALERLRIQHDAALFLPAAITGSHVGPRTCHTSGRVLDMSFRGWVAAQRHMGFEMDPRELTEDEAATLREITLWWKTNRDWRMQADILRLDSRDPAVIAEAQLAQDGSRFVVFVGQAATSAQIAPRPLALCGLDPEAMYEVDLVNRDQASHLSRGAMPIKDGPLTLSGQALMRHGLTLPWRFPGTMWVVEGRRL
ncbi:alpha-galactosidase [Pseudoponticoccus marisrubri]|nr:alpha-galactosidase [Pseudoponticoccus marisrubri]